MTGGGALERWASPSTPVALSKAERQHRGEVAQVVRDTKLAGLRVDAEAALTGRIMERAVDVDTYRKQLAGGDPVLDAVLTRIEVNFVDAAAKLQRRLNSDMPL